MPAFEGSLKASRLAASANVSHDAIDPCVFFEELLERGRRCEHIDRTRLVVEHIGK
jgi:hypothetical protein